MRGDNDSKFLVYAIYCAFGREVQAINKVSIDDGKTVMLMNQAAVNARLIARPKDLNTMYSILGSRIRNKDDAIAYITWVMIFEKSFNNKRAMGIFNEAYKKIISNIEYYGDRDTIGYLWFLYSDLKMDKGFSQDLVFLKHLKSRSRFDHARFGLALQARGVDIEILEKLLLARSLNTSSQEMALCQDSLE